MLRLVTLTNLLCYAALHMGLCQSPWAAGTDTGEAKLDCVTVHCVTQDTTPR